MKITVELEISDVIEEHTVPTEEERKQKPCGWRQCQKCGGLRFGHLVGEPMEGAPGYFSHNSQSTIPLVICLGCHKLMAAQ